MLSTEDVSMHHYVGFSQIGSNMHSRILLVAGLEHTWHSSLLAFFSSLLAGELSGCLCLVGSIAIPINQHLDTKKHTRETSKTVTRVLPLMVPFSDDQCHGTTALIQYVKLIEERVNFKNTAMIT